MLKNIIKFLKKYYLLFILIYLLITNLLLKNLIVTGLLYYIYIILLGVITSFIIYKNNNDLKFKNILYPLFLINILFSKNIFYTIISLIIILLITILNFMQSKTIKISLLILSIFIIITSPLIFIVLILPFDKSHNIYEDTHYYCNNYEIYMHSAGAMDSFYYSVTINYYLINLNNIIKIVYKENLGDTLEDYDYILNNFDCKLVVKENEPNT